MTNELEKQFFQCFGIEEKELEYPDNFTYYPEITDSILLELICILNKSRLVSAVNLRDFNYEDLKNTILRKNITILKNEFLNNEIKNEFKQQVRKLFEEEIFTK